MWMAWLYKNRMDGQHRELFTAFKDLEYKKRVQMQPSSSPTALRYQNIATGKRFTGAQVERLEKLATGSWVLKDSKDASHFLADFNKRVLRNKRMTVNKKRDPTRQGAAFPSWAKTAPSLETWDFSALYTNLPKAQIIANFERQVQRLQDKWGRVGGPLGVIISLDLDGPVEFSASFARKANELGANDTFEASLTWGGVKELFALALNSCAVRFNGEWHEQVNAKPPAIIDH